MWPFKKKIKLTAITATPNLKKMFPIVPAEDRLPSWYKSTPLTYEIGVCPVQHSITNTGMTIKGCTGVNRLLRTGFIIPAWEDISLVVYPDGQVSGVGAYTNPPIKLHDKRQSPSPLSNYTIVKLLSPWHLYGDDTEYLITPVPYHTALSRTYYTPSGIVNYKYQHNTNVFLAVEPKSEPYEILIKAGQPLMQLIPISEKAVTLEVKYDPTIVVERVTQFFLLHPYSRYVNWLKRKRDAS